MHLLVKTFIFGAVLGVAIAALSLHVFSAVDQHREASIVSVAPNGSNIESFHINVPMDRIMAGASDRSAPLPAGMEWPKDEKFQNIRAEMFKIRNAHDIVIGVAARTAAAEESGAVIDWILHLPARGSIFVTMPAAAQQGAYRQGTIRGGSREFSSLVGTMTERWVANTSADQDEPAGRIELDTSYQRAQGAT